MTESTRAPRALLLPVFFVVLTDIIAMTLVVPLLPLYGEHLGATPFRATLLVSTFAACQFVASPALGALSDRFGRKPVLLFSQVGTLLGLLLMARAESLWLVYVARALDGVTAGNLSIAQALLADRTPPERRSAAFAVLGVALGLGFIIGPVAAGLLSERSLATPIYAAAGLSALSIVLTGVLVPGGGPTPPAPLPGEGGREAPWAEGEGAPKGTWAVYARHFGRPGLRGELVQYLLFALAFAIFMSGFALFAERRLVFEGRAFGPREVGFVLAYAGLVGVVLQAALVGRLVRRFGEPVLVRVGFFVACLSYAAFGLVEQVPALFVVATLNSAGTGLIRSTLMGLISRKAGASEQGAVLGLSQSLNSLANVAGPALGGFLIGSGWLPAWALAPAAFTLAGLALTMRGGSEKEAYA